MIPLGIEELAPPDEGLSYVLPFNGNLSDKFTLKETQDLLGSELVGSELINKYGGWPMYSKFFDYQAPLFFHLHLDFEAAKRIGRSGKPEAYYFPPQLNNYPGDFPFSFFGFSPDVTKEMVQERLLRYEEGDTRLSLIHI